MSYCGPLRSAEAREARSLKGTVLIVSPTSATKAGPQAWCQEQAFGMLV